MCHQFFFCCNHYQFEYQTRLKYIVMLCIPYIRAQATQINKQYIYPKINYLNRPSCGTGISKIPTSTNTLHICNIIVQLILRYFVQFQLILEVAIYIKIQVRIAAQSIYLVTNKIVSKFEFCHFFGYYNTNQNSDTKRSIVILSSPIFHQNQTHVNILPSQQSICFRHLELTLHNTFFINSYQGISKNRLQYITKKPHQLKITSQLKTIDQQQKGIYSLRQFKAFTYIRTDIPYKNSQRKTVPQQHR
eukprot:TRINITY_DN4198_c0_g1_i10.p1 TRINITY_DN4198_c0_g1~~TRINITY_DN4198_c0_g1_i10.p1  ORF type:complete len:284 (+),score=-27.29 TRINITY_DN4198_c0_g1_i10:112-852(+)